MFYDTGDGDGDREGGRPIFVPYILPSISRHTLGPLVGRRRALVVSSGPMVLPGGLVVACRAVVAWRGGLSLSALSAHRSLHGLLPCALPCMTSAQAFLFFRPRRDLCCE